MQDGGMQVVNVHAFLNRWITEFVGYAVYKATFYSAAGQQQALTQRVVAPGRFIFCSLLSLRHGRAPEFACPDNQRVVPQSLALQIRKESGDGLIHLAAFFVSALSMLP